MKLSRMFALAAVPAACTASAATGTWITLKSGGDWSDTANWEGGNKPAADGTADVVISNDTVSASVNRSITVDEAVSVNSLYLVQGNTINTKDEFIGTGPMTIGAGGISSRNFLYPGAPTGSSQIYGRLPIFRCPIVLGASQVWQTSYDGQINGDWCVDIYNNISGAETVDWMLTGSKWRFYGGNSEAFHGTAYPQQSVQFYGADQFNRLGSKIVLCDTNCFNSAFTKPNPALVFFHTESGTGIVASAIHFDCTNTTDVAPTIKVSQINPSQENTTIFRGKWTGAVRGYGGINLNPNGNRHNHGMVPSDSSVAGMFRPETSVWRFENDTSELSVEKQYLTSGNKWFKLVGNIFVMAGDNAFGPGNNLWDAGFYVSGGRPQRLAGLLMTDGRTLNPNDKSGAIQIGAVNYPAGTVMLIGIAESGCAEGKMLNMDGANAANGGEAPVWFYAVPGGTYRQSGVFVYNGTGVRYLPIQIWGGGTVIMSTTVAYGDNVMKKDGSPVWVRDGRLVVGGTAAAHGIKYADVQVGVNHPKSFTVKAMEMSAISGSTTYSSDFMTLTFKTAPTPDGVSLSTGDRVLLNCPSTDGYPRYNGIWEVTGDNVWTRIDELNESDECLPDIRVDVESGTLWAGTRWFLMNEPYRICQRLGTATTQTFDNNEYCLAFYQDVRPNPDVSLLLEGDRTLTNLVTVVDNQSTGKSELGGYTIDSTPTFAGPISISKPVLTLTANTNSTVTFSGEMSGTVGIAKTGPGEVVLSPSGENLSVTNLALASGKLSISPALLASGVDEVDFVYSGGDTATLELTGDVDLTDWTLNVKGLFRPERGATEMPASFTFAVSSSDGTVSGTPAIRIVGEKRDTDWWTVLPLGGNVWRASCFKPAFIFVVR